MHSSAYHGRDWPYGKSTGTPVCWPYAREDGHARHEDGSRRTRKDRNPGHARRGDKADCSREMSDENAQFRWWLLPCWARWRSMLVVQGGRRRMSSPAIYLSLVIGKNEQERRSQLDLSDQRRRRGKVAHTKEREDCSLSLAPVILRYGCKIRGTQLDGRSS